MFFYRITLKNHLKNSWTVLIYLVLSLVYILYMVARYGFDDVLFFISSGIVFFFIFFVPVIIIHLNYYLTNKGDLFIYDGLNERISYSRKGKTLDFFFEDIKYIRRFKSYPLAENRLQWTPWDSYNYSIIYLQNGEKVIVTSLLVPNLDLPVPQTKKHLIKSFFCYVTVGDEDELIVSTSSSKVPDVFKRIVKEKSTEELKEIIGSKGQYDELFILSASIELEKRKQS